MPSLAEMGETCDRLLEELRQDADRHRLLEIETIIRLLVPHLTRAVADVVHTGRAEQLGDARLALLQMRDHLSWVRNSPDSPPALTQQRLIQAVECAGDVLKELERL